MTIKERKIKEEVLKELEVPNILQKIKPVANEQATIYQENNKTIRLNFQRPARILVTCVACLIGVMIFILVGVSINNNKPVAKDSENASFDSNFSDSAEHQDKAEQYTASPSEPELTISPEFESYYNSKVTTDVLSSDDLKNYYSQISSYVSNNKTLDEILNYYQEDDECMHEESIRIIYEYLTK